jgi:hypothetical protein
MEHRAAAWSHPHPPTHAHLLRAVPRRCPAPAPSPTRPAQSLAYTSAALGYFMVNTLMPVVRPENYRAAHVPQLPGGGAGSRLAEAQKNYFVLAAGGAQFLLLWWLGPKL